MTSSLSLLLIQYGESHKNITNIIIHKICVPLIMLSLLGLLHQIPGPVNWSYTAVLAVFLFYLRFKNLSVLAIYLIQALPMLFFIHIQNSFGFTMWLSVFFLAWVGQFIGHKIEGKKPSFFQDLFFLLIGPIWIFKRFIKE